MLTPAMARARHRQPAGWRRAVRVGLALVCALAALVAIKELVHDVRVDRALSHRGVAATGHLLDTHCHLCRAVGVTYTETDGVAVSTVVSAIGPQDNATIALKYDPKQPSVVHPPGAWSRRSCSRRWFSRWDCSSHCVASTSPAAVAGTGQGCARRAVPRTT